jgi:N-acetylglucosaminyldiphosphoundecaprenol N-acetyl-beta-D-mannosaminyltransferase
MDVPYRLSLLGAEVDCLTPPFVMDFLADRVAAGQRAIVANHNLHSLYLYQKSAEMRAFYAKADLIEIDSVPMIAWGRLIGYPLSRANRCTYLDFRDDLWTRAQRHGWRVAHVGGAPEHNELSRQAILARHPQVHLDVFTGYFDVNGPANDQLIRDLHACKPDLLLVGMGMPRQESWILRNLERLPHCVILPVGAAFDYEAGVMYTAPRWTGQLGLEWLVRFVHEPRRLFERYFYEPWFLVPQMARDILRPRSDTESLSRPA